MRLLTPDERLLLNSDRGDIHRGSAFARSKSGKVVVRGCDGELPIRCIARRLGPLMFNQRRFSSERLSLSSDVEP